MYLQKKLAYTAFDNYGLLRYSTRQMFLKVEQIYTLYAQFIYRTIFRLLP